MIIPVLSIRQPWAWAIIHGGKDIENRDWTTKFRGRFLVHAAKKCTRDEWSASAWRMFDAQGRVAVPGLPSLELGGIIGSVELVDVVEKSDSPWFVGRYGLVLREPRPLPFTPCKGQLGFFECPPDAAKPLREWQKRQT